MTPTDEEILRAAARIRAGRRVAKMCEVCGTPFEGIAQRRYCSDACRVKASRQRTGAATAIPAASDRAASRPDGRHQPTLAPRGTNESIDDYLDRVQAYVLGTNGVDGDAADRDAAAGQDRDAVADLAAEPPRGEGQSIGGYFQRIGRAVTRGLDPRELEDWEDSVEIIRQMREERTAALLRASGMVEPEGEPPAPRGEDEPLMDYLDRVTAYVMGDQVFEDDSARLVRQGRQERTAELLRAIESESVKQ
jgi:hypothetical protein